MHVHQALSTRGCLAVVPHGSCALAGALAIIQRRCLDLCRHVPAMQIRHETRLAGTEDLLAILRASACISDQTATDRHVSQMSPRSLQKQGHVHHGHLTDFPAKEQDQDCPVWYTGAP